MVQPPPLLFDRMLGRLCRKMRLLGLDAALCPPGESGRFLLLAERDGRIAVTRARRRDDRPGRRPIVLVSHILEDQIVELLRALGPVREFSPFTRCLECNAELEKESADSAGALVPPNVRELFNVFHGCPSCGRIYWEGSHFEAMSREVEAIRKLLC